MLHESVVTPPEALRSVRYSDLSPRRVVVASSHSGVREALTRLLHSGGYQVVQATEPDELCEEMGRSIVRRETTGAVDFTLVDTRGPSGHASLALLATLPPESRRAIFAIVALRDDTATERALAIGASIIHAPYDAGELLDSILDIAPPFEIGLPFEESAS